MIPPQFYKTTYSEDDVAFLCRIGGVQPDDPNEFRESLDGSAAVYRWEASKWEDLPRSSDIARDLKSVLNRAMRLRVALEELPEDAEWALKSGIDNSLSRDFAQAVTDNLKPDAPTLMLMVSQPDENFHALNLELGDLRKIIGSLEITARKTIEDLPKKSPGQNRDWALRIWMKNMKKLWERTTDIPFTRDVTSTNEPITGAACFCDAAFKMINPDYPTSRIMREMKDCIAQSNRRTGRIIAQNDQ